MGSKHAQVQIPSCLYRTDSLQKAVPAAGTLPARSGGCPFRFFFSDRAGCFSDRARFSIRPAGSGRLHFFSDLRMFSIGPGLVLDRTGLVLDRTYKRQKPGPARVEGSQERLLKAQKTISTPHNSVLETQLPFQTSSWKVLKNGNVHS